MRFANRLLVAQGSVCTRFSMRPRQSTASPQPRQASCTCAGARSSKLLVRLGLDYFFAAVKAVWTDVVAQMRLTRGGFGGQRRRAQKVMGAVHAALRRRLLVLLDCHDNSLNLARYFSMGSLERPRRQLLRTHARLTLIVPFQPLQGRKGRGGQIFCHNQRLRTVGMLWRERQRQQHFVFDQGVHVKRFAANDRIEFILVYR